MPNASPHPRVLIVAENASAKFGGEAILPLHYFRLLRARGVEAWLLVNHRNKAELETVLSPDELARVTFVPDTWFHQWLERVAKPFPAAIKHATFRFVGRLVSGFNARRLARELVRAHGVDVVHQPTPVSPKEISLLSKLGAPVVIGPMNGGMTYPPGFARSQPRWVAAVVGIGRAASHGMNRLFPGKLRAHTLLVANDRTRQALPRGVRGTVQTLVENGVKLDLWKPVDRSTPGDGPVRFVFSGRLVDWKGVQYLIDAFALVSNDTPATLQIMGSGPMRAALEQRALAANVGDRVKFLGWMSQADCATVIAAGDVFVLPSVYECGGAVVLEAMAAGLPVIATNWGGPADYLEPTCGLLIDPGSPTTFVSRLAEAMRALAKDGEQRRRLGAAGRARAVEQFDWQRKIDRILTVYDDVRRPA